MTGFGIYIDFKNITFFRYCEIYVACASEHCACMCAMSGNMIFQQNKYMYADCSLISCFICNTMKSNNSIVYHYIIIFAIIA